MAEAKPHIIFVVLDTHRADKLSIYGYHRRTTPTLEAFAEQATVFDQAIAAAQWTIPSHASMFTGLYPTVHQTTQSFTALPDSVPTLAELLRGAGYETVAFCNNPLIGVMDNGLKRGFNNFYNYSTTFPDIPKLGDEKGLRRFQRLATEFLTNNLSGPIERRFGQSPLLLRLAMMPLFVPIWSRFMSFKGDTHQSISDVTAYLRYHFAARRDQPLFLFANLMETHLPYYPPSSVLDRWAPQMRRDRAAREFMQSFNNSSYKWIAPVIEPLDELQDQTLHDVYDAEIAYQDQELRRLFRALKKSGQADNTLVVVLSDHGESHGDHQYMGHSFTVYQELSHVPLMIRYPRGFPAGQRVAGPVSTRRIFHTVLEAAGVAFEGHEQSAPSLSLARAVDGKQPEHEHVVAEAYPPLNFVNVMEANHPAAIERFRVRETRRAIYGHGVKLLTLGGRLDEFFDLRRDPLETANLLDDPRGHENEIVRLERDLDQFVAEAEAQRDGVAVGERVDYSNHPQLVERLRGLGYIE